MLYKFWQEALEYKETIIGIILGVILLSLFVILPLFFTANPYQTSLNIFSPPNSKSLLGTNDVGQDIFSRLIVGGQNSLRVALGVGIFSTFLAVGIGVWSALAGGLIDNLLMRMVDILLVIPNIIIIIIISAYVSPTILLEIIIISLFTWLVGARVVRAQVLSIKERTYVYAAALFGAGPFYLFLKHLLPELIPLMLTLFLQGMRRAVFIEAGLAFIGVVNPNVISWGSMISQSLNYYYLDVWQWWLLPTAGALSLSLISLTLIGYGLEEALISSSERRKIIAADS